MRAFLRGLRKQHPVVGNYSAGVAVDMRKSGDQRVTKAGFEFIKVRVVDYPFNDLTDVIWHAQVGGHDVEQRVRVQLWWQRVTAQRVCGPDRTVRDGLARKCQCMCVVFGQIVGHA